MRRPTIVSAAFALAVCASPSFAITSKEVLGKMSQDERFGYLTGLIDMLSYRELLAGNKAHAQCLSDAFYKDDKMAGRLIDSLRKFPDKAPEGIVYLLMKKKCGG